MFTTFTFAVITIGVLILIPIIFNYPDNRHPFVSIFLVIVAFLFITNNIWTQVVIEGPGGFRVEIKSVREIIQSQQELLYSIQKTQPQEKQKEFEALLKKLEQQNQKLEQIENNSSITDKNIFQAFREALIVSTKTTRDTVTAINR